MKTETYRFMDQMDADEYADNFINKIYTELAATCPNIEIERHNLAKDDHVVDGRIITLWRGERVVAIANVMRTPLNWSHVVCNRVIEA